MPPVWGAAATRARPPTLPRLRLAGLVLRLMDSWDLLDRMRLEIQEGAEAERLRKQVVELEFDLQDEIATSSRLTERIQELTETARQVSSELQYVLRIVSDLFGPDWMTHEDLALEDRWMLVRLVHSVQEDTHPAARVTAFAR